MNLDLAGKSVVINSFMKTIAKENGRYGIRCNVVCSGVTVPEEAEDVGSTACGLTLPACLLPSSWKSSQRLAIEESWAARGRS
ncbi:MAG TPA: hypothetical protein PK372_01400 [Rugosibacter sp.]|nr:hypothetical protein [Rugosibacter sp.]HPB89890.1 hypothetical protein [Rugosibacter sp.]HQN46148.1 hypothetical protein [Rugosibacter sp.]HQQ34580.1 hypothetical protein [Rugosibacter sp.]